MTIKLLCIGKTDSKELQKLIEVYLKRLQFYTKFEIDVIPDLKKARNLDENQQKTKQQIKPTATTTQVKQPSIQKSYGIT